MKYVVHTTLLANLRKKNFILKIIFIYPYLSGTIPGVKQLTELFHLRIILPYFLL